VLQKPGSIFWWLSFIPWTNGSSRPSLLKRYNPRLRDSDPETWKQVHCFALLAFDSEP